MGRIKIEVGIPVHSLISLEISERLNEHSRARIQMIVEENQSQGLMRPFDREQIVRIFDHEGEHVRLLFYGQVEQIIWSQKEQILYAELLAVSHTVLLDRAKKSCSFQNPDLSYEEVVDQLLEEYQTRVLWEVEAGTKILAPMIQYQETDWEFLIRLASHRRRKLQVSAMSQWADIHIGMRDGVERTLLPEQILEWGMSRSYYQSGGYEREEARWMYHYLTVRHSDFWELGDTVWYQKNRYQLLERKIRWEGETLSCCYQLGAEGMVVSKRKGHPHLSGLQLSGRVVSLEGERVFVQFDMDEKENADYGWMWKPEVGNLCYVMPEIGSRVMVSFFSDREENGCATHLLWKEEEKEAARNTQNREFTTLYHKKLALHPETISLAGQAGSVTLIDQMGIQIKSKRKIQIMAQEEIRLHAKRIEINAPKRIAMQTEGANIELEKDFNFYGRNGVITFGQEQQERLEKTSDVSNKNDREGAMYGQIAYAVIGAIPAVNLAAAEEQMEINLAVCGAIPSLRQGSLVIAMEDVLNGKREQDKTFPRAFEAIGNYTNKGGYSLLKYKDEG